MSETDRGEWAEEVCKFLIFSPVFIAAAWVLYQRLSPLWRGE